MGFAGLLIKSKHLQFSTRPFYFENEYYVIVIIDDVTKFGDPEKRQRRPQQGAQVRVYYT